jgi:hypothetical protein
MTDDEGKSGDMVRKPGEDESDKDRTLPGHNTSDNFNSTSESEPDSLYASVDYLSDKGNLISEQFAFIDNHGMCTSCGDAAASQ